MVSKIAAQFNQPFVKSTKDQIKDKSEAVIS